MTDNRPHVSFSQVLWAAKSSIEDERRVAPGPDNPQDDVAVVQEALKAAVGLTGEQKGFFDGPTVGAYMAWQKKLGYSGSDADGVPGLTSFNKLSENRFVVTDTSGSYSPTFVETPVVGTVSSLATDLETSVERVLAAVAKLVTATPEVEVVEVVVEEAESTTPSTPTPAPVPVEKPWIWADVGSAPHKWPASADTVRDALKREFPGVDVANDNAVWGAKTTAAYKKWQESLGFTGADASGLPGKTSLTKLAEKYGFDIRGEFPTSTPGRISPNQIDFSGKGSWDSGEAACTRYVREAVKIMGLPETHWVRGMVTIAGRETAFNSPQWQINTTDSNARNVSELFNGGNAPDGYAGMCSRGMIQAIPQTFARYHQAGTSLKIYDPVASAAAGINYIIQVYGVNRDGSNLTAKVQQADPNRPPRGY